MMRGKMEKGDSKIKEIYMSQLEYKRKDKQKNGINFVSVNDIEEKLNSIQLRASRQGQRPHHASGVDLKVQQRETFVVPNNFTSVAQFYENAFTRARQPHQMRSGTPISDGQANDFPSPRVGLEDVNSRNYELLPHTFGNNIDLDNFMPPGCKSIMKQKRLRKPIPMKHDHRDGKNQGEYITETKVRNVILNA